MKKIGLVLEGGAMRGMYTAGIIDTFLDENIEVDTIIGVSAGALFGINYLSKQKGRVLRYNKKYANDKNYMGLHSLITTGNLVNTDFAYNKLPMELDPFDEKTFRKSKTKFYATVTNVENGEAEYIQITDTYKQIDAFRASGSMPFVSQIVEYDNKKYLDGALADSIPIKKMQEMGCDKIIVVLTKPDNYRKKKHPEFIAKAYYKKYPALAKAINTRYKIYNETLDYIEELESKKEIFVLRPSKDLKISRVEKDVDKIEAQYNLGVSDCKSALSKLKKFIEK